MAQETIHAIQAATATATGAQIDMQDAKKVVVVCKRSNHTAGSTAFTVQVSQDAMSTAAASSTWVGYNKLIDNVTNTNAQALTRIATKTLSSNTTDFVTMDLKNGDAFRKMRVVATETTDGTHDAWVIIQR